MSANPEDLGLAYLAAPYSRYVGGIAPAFVDACKLTAKLMTCGVKVYSPIVHCHSIAMHGAINPLDHNIWLPFDMAMMTAADTLIVARMAGWESSFGIGEEIKFFKAAGKPIYDLDPATLLMTRRKASGVPRLEELRSILTRSPKESEPKPSLTYESAMARVEELDKEIAAYPHWGAALTAMDEERKGLLGFIAREMMPLAHGKTNRTHAGTSE